MSKWNVTYIPDGDMCTRTDSFEGTREEVRNELRRYADIIKMVKVDELD